MADTAVYAYNLANVLVHEPLADYPAFSTDSTNEVCHRHNFQYPKGQSCPACNNDATFNGSHVLQN